MHRGRSAEHAVRSDALLLRRVALGESDLLVTLLTEARGVVSVAARSARKSARRFPALEPMHVLSVTIDVRAGAEVGKLLEATIARPRSALVADLAALDAAGRALRWVRAIAPPHTPDADLWRATNALLDALDRPLDQGRAWRVLAHGGLALLRALGWALELDRCVSCGTPCTPSRSAYADAARGGLICRACGGARVFIPGDVRARLLAAVASPLGSSGDEVLADGDDRIALELCESAFEAHAGVDRRARDART